MWPLILAGGVWLLCEGARQAGRERHEQRMKEISKANRRKQLAYAPDDEIPELSYDEFDDEDD